MATAGASSVGKSQWNPKEHVEYLFTESLHQIMTVFFTKKTESEVEGLLTSLGIKL